MTNNDDDERRRRRTNDDDNDERQLPGDADADEVDASTLAASRKAKIKIRKGGTVLGGKRTVFDEAGGRSRTSSAAPSRASSQRKLNARAVPPLHSTRLRVSRPCATRSKERPQLIASVSASVCARSTRNRSARGRLRKRRRRVVAMPARRRSWVLLRRARASVTRKRRSIGSTSRPSQGEAAENDGRRCHPQTMSRLPSASLRRCWVRTESRVSPTKLRLCPVYVMYCRWPQSPQTQNADVDARWMLAEFPRKIH